MKPSEWSLKVCPGILRTMPGLHWLVVIDRLSAARRALGSVIFTALVAAVCATMTTLRTEGNLRLWSGVYGCVTGCRMALMEVIYASLFGTRALGSILGVSRGCDVAATGLGPVLFSAAFDSTGSYAPAIALSASSNLVISLVALMLVCRKLGPRTHHGDQYKSPSNI